MKGITSQPHEKVTSSLSFQPRGHQFLPVNNVQEPRSNIKTAVNADIFLRFLEEKKEIKRKTATRIQPCSEFRAIASKECKMLHSASIGTRPSSQTVGTAQIMADSNSHSSNLEPPSCDPGQFTFSLLGERTQISEGLKGVTQLIVQKAIEHAYMCVWGCAS